MYSMTELIVHNAVDTSPKCIKFTILSFNLMYNMLGVSNYLSDIDNTLLGFFGIHASLKSFTLITLSSIIKKKKMCRAEIYIAHKFCFTV